MRIINEKKIVNQILKKYSLDLNVGIERIHFGIDNYNFVITDNKKYVLHIYKKKTYPEIIKEVKLMQYLIGKKAPLPQIIETKNGNLISNNEDKYAVLFEFIQGEHPPWAHLDLGLCSDIGNKLANMHKSLLEFKSNDYAIQLADSFSDLSNFNKIDEFLINKKQTTIKELKNYELSKLRISIIHGDICRENLIIHKNKLVAIIDFSDAHKDYLVWDLATALSQLFITKTAGIDWKGLEAFLKAYTKENALNQQEKSILITFMKLVNIKLALIMDSQMEEDKTEDLLSIKTSLLTKLILIEENQKRLENLTSKYS